MAWELWAPNGRGRESHSLSPANAQVLTPLWITGIDADRS